MILDADFWAGVAGFGMTYLLYLIVAMFVLDSLRPRWWIRRRTQIESMSRLITVPLALGVCFALALVRAFIGPLPALHPLYF